MHIPAYHGEHDGAVLEAFIRAHPLGQLTTALPLAGQETLQVSHVPWVLTPADAGAGRPAVLRGHMARANPQVKAILAALEAEAAEAADGLGGGPSSTGKGTLREHVLVLFNADAHAYVPPRFYRGTKPSTGRTVPTWDYAAVQVYGRVTCLFGKPAPPGDTQTETETGEFLTRLLDDLSLQSETDAAALDRTAAGAPALWSPADAPARYTAALKRAIVGVEIEVAHMEGRFKLSQEMRGADHAGVVDGFRARASQHGNAIADMVQERGRIRDERARAKADTKEDADEDADEDAAA